MKRAMNTDQLEVEAARDIYIFFFFWKKNFAKYLLHTYFGKKIVPKI